MLGTGVHLQHLLHVLARQRGLGQHAPDRLLDHALGMLAEHFLHWRKPFVAHVPRVPEVALLFDLAARQLHLLGVDDDDEITAVDVRRERRLVFAPQDLGDAAGPPAQRLARRADQAPATRRVLRLRSIGLHDYEVLGFWQTRTPNPAYARV